MKKETRAYDSHVHRADDGANLTHAVVTMTNGDTHVVALNNVDELDEEDDELIQVYIWCENHGAYEWHWLPQVWVK